MTKTSADILKKKRIRAKISGTPERPRLAVNISNRHVVAQLIDDTTATTLCFITTVGEASLKGKTMTDQAIWAGEQIAAKAKTKKIETVLFDRGIHVYHGRVKALAGAAREKGLKF